VTESSIENDLQPNDWFFRQRAYPQGKINKTAYSEAQRYRKDLLIKQKATRGNQPAWYSCGPTNIGGRLVDVEMHDLDTLTIFVGTAAGGVFKSEDLGQSWTAVFDEQPSLSIGDIAISPSDPNQIYVGTGEANGGGGSLTYDGLGVFKSTDGGESWEDIGLNNVGSIGKVVVDPINPNRLYVAAMGDLFGNNSDRGLYISEDGGITWKHALFVNDSTGVIDIAIHPENGDIVYAASWQRVRRHNTRKYGGPGCAIHKTVDGGETWTELEGTGLPSLNKGRIGIAIANSNPDVLYAIYADISGDYKNIYKSLNAGESWEEVPAPPLNWLYATYGWWFGKIVVDPTDEDRVFVLGLDLFLTEDGGDSWSNVSHELVHIDQHAVYIHPQNTDLVLIGNDGGLYVSKSGGAVATWEHRENMPITQFYTIEVDEQNPERLFGGTQDNSSMRTISGEPDDWEIIFSGDGFATLVDPIDNSFVYTEYQYGNLAKSTSGGAPGTFLGATMGIDADDRRNWSTPVVFDPSNTTTLYYGTYRLFRSTDQADSWTPISGDLTNGEIPGNLIFATLTTISVSPADEDVIYTGSDDGSIHITTNGGGSWTSIDADLPNRWVTKIEAHPTNPMTAYLTISGFRHNETLPHVFKTTNQGTTWKSIHSNLPDIPVNDIVVDPNNKGWLYIATDLGVFASFSDGENWILFGKDLPNVPIIDIRLHNPTRTLIAATYGRSVYKIGLDEVTSIDQALSEDQTNPLQVFPNPLTTDSKVYVELLDFDQIELQLFDAQGRLLETIFDGKLTTGKHVFDLPIITETGTYFCRLKINQKKYSQTLVFVK